MKKILCVIVFSLIIFLLSVCSSLLSEKRVLNNEKWIEDIKYLDANLRKEHPNIFKYVEEDEWNQSIESLIVDIPKLSDSSIILRTSQIIASLGDGHTFINPLDLITPFGQEHIKPESVVEFPIKCEYFDDGVRVVECDSKYKDILGYKLISINNIDINKILSDIATLISHDYKNEQCSLVYAKKFMNIYDILKFFEVVDSYRATFNFENDKKEIISLELKAIENKKINYISKNKKNMKTNEVPSGENEVYWYKNFEDDEILYFRLNKFTTNFHIFKDKKPDKEPPDFREVQERLISEINKHNYSKFIIDLRENRGGDVNILNAVVDMIKFQTDLKGEDIYILTGKESASASVTLAWKLQSTLGATVVGETTGGNVNLFTTCNQSLELPNSNLNIYYPFKESIYKKGYIGGVNPDFEVRQNYSDYLNGVDTCYEFIKNLNLSK